MAIPSGLAAQLGVAEETTWGTVVTPSRFYEFRNESLAQTIERMESQGLRAGTRVLRSDRWVAGQKEVGGNIEMEVANRSFGLWLKHALGTIATTQPDAVNDPTVYDHTATPGDLPVGLTTQVGRPDEAGTVHPFTYHGCRVASWELSANVGEIGVLSVSLTGEDEDTSTALAAASYPAGLTLLTFVEATLQIAAASVDVRSITLRGDNGLNADRPQLGSQLRRQATEADMRTYDGDIDAYFADLVAYNRFVNGTEAALELLFQGAVIAGGTGSFNYELKATANVRFDGETPNVDGPDELDQPLAFKCLDSGTGPGSALTIVYRTDDSTP